MTVLTALFCLCIAVSAEAAALTIRVDPRTTSVHQAAAAARAHHESHGASDLVEVLLSPGTHHTGDAPLTLGPADSNTIWRSADSANPAVLGAPIRVTGWKAGKTPTGKVAMVAPLPANVTAGSALRQFWVKGARASRPIIIGHGRQPGDNKQVTPS